MGLLSIDDLRKKTQKATAEALAKTVVLGKSVSNYVDEKKTEVGKAVSDYIIETKPKVEKVVDDTVDAAKSKSKNIKETIAKNMSSKTMTSHKILMMGGKRAGKSTILASILYVLKKEAPGSLYTINDITDYTQMIIDGDGKTHPLPTLDQKRLEVIQYMKKHSENTSFLVDMNQTYGKNTYTLKVNTGQTNIGLEFIDVPGEWMRRNVPEFNVLKDQVMSSDVFVIAVDTPYLMQDDEDVNAVYNRIQEITDVISEMKINPNVEADRRQIILCPVKCEKWIKAGLADSVTAKVKRAYKDMINTWIKFPNVDIWIMPIQTVGGLESARLLPAKLYFKDSNDRHGTTCSEDETTGLIIDKEGNTIDPGDIYCLEDDKKWIIDHMEIPLSWYRKNSSGFKPVYCEQPGFHILRFLVEKEEEIIKQKANKDRMEMEEWGVFTRFLARIFTPTLGQYLPVWRDVIDEMTKQGLLKNQGDGFEHVTQIVE